MPCVTGVYLSDISNTIFFLSILRLDASCLSICSCCFELGSAWLINICLTSVQKDTLSLYFLSMISVNGPLTNEDPSFETPFPDF